jgi:hypothetical protein
MCEAILQRRVVEAFAPLGDPMEQLKQLIIVETKLFADLLFAASAAVGV